MSLFGFLSAQIEVRENNGVITVTGVKHAGNMINRLGKVFNTTRVPTYMFNTLASNRFSFYSYFAIDVIYAFRKLLARKDPHLYVPVKTIETIIEKIEQETWVKNTFKEYPSKLNYDKLEDFVFTPLPHQLESFKFYDKVTQQHGLNGAIMAIAAGGAKTLLSLMLSRMLEVNQTVIVCPLPTVYNVWVKNITDYIKRPATYWYSTSNTTLKGNEEFIVIHYEYLQKLIDQLKFLKGKRFCVILDESHNLNETTANRSKLFVQLCKQLNSKETIMLSGTPFKAVAMEAVPTISCVDPLFTDAVEERFRKVYAGTNLQTNEMLNGRLQVYMKVVKKDVLSLDKPIEEVIKVQVPNGNEFTLPAIKKKMTDFISERLKYYNDRQKDDWKFYFDCLDTHARTLNGSERSMFKEYQDAVKQIHQVTGVYYGVVEQMKFANQYEKNKIIPSLPKEHKKRFEEVKTIYKYLSLKINGECLGTVIGGARIACHVAMVPHIPIEEIVDRTEKKTLIFTSFVDVVKAVRDQVTAVGLKPLTAFAENTKDLNKTVEQFANNKDYDPLVTTYATLSTGVPLIMADKLILINQPFRPHILNQAIARVWRLGQTSQVYVFKCELDTGEVPNISTRSSDILEWARESVKQITGVDYVETETETSTSTVGLEDFYSNQLV